MNVKTFSNTLNLGVNLNDGLNRKANDNKINEIGEPVLKFSECSQPKIIASETPNHGNVPLAERKIKKLSVDVENISKAWDAAQTFYRKNFPDFDGIQILHNGKKVLFKGLPRNEQIDLLREGARGADKDAVDKLANDDPNLSDEDFQKRVSDLLGVVPGEKSRDHGADHAMRAALLVEGVALLYGEIFEKFSQLTSEDLENAIIAAMFHDSGRQSDGIDMYDELSASNAEEALNGIFDETRRKKIANIISNKDADLTQKSLATILLHEADCLEYIRLDGFNARYLDALHSTSSHKKPSFFNFKLNPKIPSEEAETKLVALIYKAAGLQKKISNFILDHADKLSSSVEIISLLNKNSYECRNSYELFRAVAEDHTFLLDTEYIYFKYKHVPCNNLPCTGKMPQVTPKGVTAFLEKNKPSELFRHENVFEISEVLLKCLENPDSELNQREDIEELKSVASLCQELKNFNALEKFAQMTAFYRLQMFEENVFQSLQSISPKDVIAISRKSSPIISRSLGALTRINLQDISSRYMNPIGQYIDTHGGSWTLVELIMSHQIASGLSLLPTIVKAWMHQQIGGNMISESPFFPDNRKPGSEITITDVRRGKSSLLANYKSGRDFGGEQGRKELLTDVTILPNSFWQNEMTKLLATKFHIFNKKLKEQAMLKDIIELLKKAQNASSEGDWDQLEKCGQQLNEYSLELDKYIQIAKQVARENFDKNEEVDENDEIFQRVTEILSHTRDAVEKINTQKQESLNNPKDFEVLSQDLAKHQVILDKISEETVADNARFYTADSLDSRIRKAAKGYETVDIPLDKPSMFDKTMCMIYAANQEILHHLERENALNQENELDSVKLYRRFDDKNKISIGEGEVVMDSSVYDSFSLQELPSSYGFGPYKYSAAVPFCRIWTSYFFKSLMNGALDNSDDCETEFTVMANGLKLTYQGKDENVETAPSFAI